MKRILINSSYGVPRKLIRKINTTVIYLKAPNRADHVSTKE